MIGKSPLIAAALLGAVTAERSEPPQYNGQLKLFIADLGPMYPCHPLFDRDNTWGDFMNSAGDYENIRKVLNSLADQGFNGVRLPLWPYSDEVRGTSVEWDRNECDLLSKKINEVIHDSRNGLNDKYWHFTLYYSPAFDAKRYQQELTSDEYSDWVRSYLKGGYGVDSLSPFSANYSIMDEEEIDEESRQVDASTIFELEVFELLSTTLQYEIEVPILVGPDRRTVRATVNTLESYDMPEEYDLRPDYRLFAQVIGTQARYADNTAIEENFEELAEEISMPVWCTMCSQEWYREAPEAQREQDGRRLDAPDGFWQNLSTFRDDPQPPASQALLGLVSGYVAEAAVPRFVKGDGSIVSERDWASGDKIVNTDGDRSTFEKDFRMQDRDDRIPPGGLRLSLDQMRNAQFCETAEDEDGNQTDDRIIPAYESCVFQLSEAEFRRAEHFDGYVDIYINHKTDVLGWIETCRVEEGGECITVDLERGVEYRFYNDPAFQILFIFENDSPKEQELELLYLAEFKNALSSFTVGALALLSVSAVLF